MNHHPGKNVSLCLLYGCSHQEFSDISRSFLFFTGRYISSAVFSGHNLGTKSRDMICRSFEIHTPINSAELRIAKAPSQPLHPLTCSGITYILKQVAAHSGQIILSRL
jgi:hypothetical protein